jgi:hypothetical protein
MADDDTAAPEEWRPVPFPEYAEIYEVSNLGRVRRVSISPTNSWKAGRVLTPTVNGKWGHLRIALYRNNKQFCQYVHRMVALAFLGPAPSPLHEVAHDDGNPANNRASNLKWKTSAGNAADSKRHGTFVVGERHFRAKLTAEQVTEIRDLYAAGGVTHETLSRRYGVHRVHIGDILRGNVWRHL